VEGARSFLEAAARKAPEDARIQGQLGWLLAEEGYFGCALETLMLAAELAPQHSQTHAALGRLYSDMQEPGLATEAFAQAARLSPSRSDMQAEWGIACYEAGRLEEAERRLDKAVALDPRNAPARFYLAQIALQRHDVLRARYQLGLVAKLEPQLDLSRFAEFDPAALGSPHSQGDRQWRLPGRRKPQR
jgi:Tfp pilus assembly protein PilF